MKFTEIPTKWVGPIKLSGEEFNFATEVPLATLEKPLWNTVARGAKLSMQGTGLNIVVVREGMTRSILLEGPNAIYVTKVTYELIQHKKELDDIVAGTSKFTQLIDWHEQIVGNLLYLRFNFSVGDAAGHNMATKAADALLNWLLQRYSQLNYVSISGNFCVDKKTSAVNGVLGRGKYVVAEMIVPEAMCLKVLRVTPAAVVNLHIKKNLLGSILAGSIRTANAHFANILLALYLATGQDAANIVEGSQGVVHAELRESDLYFSVTLPNIIVGTVGSGKDLTFVRENLQQLGCLPEVQPYKQGGSARKLAALIAASVWCGEISLLAAQTNRGELVRSHMVLER